MLAHADTLAGAAHIAALEEVLAVFDPQSEQARKLRVHIQSDRALGERRVRRLISPYAPAKIKLMWLYDGPNTRRGAGLRVHLNQKHTVTLLLDTGASGIALSPKDAEKADLEMLERGKQ
jgi:hypothetical protein